AVLFAELRLGLVLLYAAFAATFGGAGFGLLFGLWASNSREKKRQALAAKYPGQPWMHRSDWRESKVRTTAATNAMIFSVVALVTTGLTAPVLFLVLDEVG